MKRLRIAMIAPPWLPIPPDGYGGIENMLDALIPELAKLGAEVELFTVGTTPDKFPTSHWLYEEAQYEHIHRPQYDSLPINGAHMLYAINKIIDKGDFDIIHDHNNYIGPLMFSHTSAKLPPVIHTLHNPRFVAPEHDECELDNKMLWKQLAQSERLRLICISDAMQKSAPTALKKIMLPYVHNAVKVKDFPYKAKKDNYFITLARFHPEKGEHIAVQSCLKLGERLRMAGPVGSLNTKHQLYMELANPLSNYRSQYDFRYFSDKIFPFIEEGKIEYEGVIGGVNKMRFLSRAKGLLFPIQWEEPFGMVPIEALACGTPVVAMARGALPEIIQHGVNRFLAKNEREFREYMQRVGEIDPAACRASVQKYFSAKVMAKAYMKRYRMVLAEAKIQ